MKYLKTYEKINSNEVFVLMIIKNASSTRPDISIVDELEESIKRLKKNKINFKFCDSGKHNKLYYYLIWDLDEDIWSIPVEDRVSYSFSANSKFIKDAGEELDYETLIKEWKIQNDAEKYNL